MKWAGLEAPKCIAIHQRVNRQACRCHLIKPQDQLLEGQLPVECVSLSAPFEKSGVDYGGPFQIKYRHMRKPIIKTYVCLFVRFTVKAVYLSLCLI